jgi:hypothetical protein
LATAADPQGFFRRRYCLDCRSIWPSVELPVEFVERLLMSRVACEELRRDIARLKFLLAQQRQCGTMLNRAA